MLFNGYLKRGIGGPSGRTLDAARTTDGANGDHLAAEKSRVGGVGWWAMTVATDPAVPEITPWKASTWRRSSPSQPPTSIHTRGLASRSVAYASPGEGGRIFGALANRPTHSRKLFLRKQLKVTKEARK